MIRAAWLALVACSSPAPAPEVTVYGALREMIHDGRIEARVAIATVAKPHAYAIGALAGMRGEVTIVDGTPWIARGEGGGAAVTDGGASASAALLVAATVPAWRDVTLAEDIPFAALDARIEEAARGAGIDVEKPFPFLVTGPLADVQWHVLTGPPAPGANPHDHARDAVTGTRATMTGTLVGFFSKRHQGVFTHMGKSVHAHVVDPSTALAAHADAVSIRAGATLRFPRLSN